MNVGEFGNVMLYNVKEDISGTLANTMVLIDPEGTEKTIEPELGTLDVDTPVGRFLANQYLAYTFEQGDVTIPGVWRTRVITQFDANKTLKTNLTRFTVDP